MERYNRYGDSRPFDLTRGYITAGYTPAKFLDILAGWLLGPGDRPLAMRYSPKLLELAGDSTLDLHFIHLHMIEVYYKERDTDPANLELAIVACERQDSRLHPGPRCVRGYGGRERPQALRS